MPISAEDSKIRRSGPVRPAFAEDVYGVTNRRSSSSEPRLSSNDKTNTGGASTASNSDLCVSSLAQRRSANLPKLRDLCTGVTYELNISSTECPMTNARSNLMGELDFVYADSDSYMVELSEFYTYSEMDEFALNYECFVKYMRGQKKEPFWNQLSRFEKCSIIHDLSANFDSSESEQRLQAARIILYILQGAYGDFSELEGKKQQKSQNLSGLGCVRNSRNRQRKRPSSHNIVEEVVENITFNKHENDSKSSDDSSDTKSGEDDDEDVWSTTGELGLPSKWFGPDHGTGDYESDCLVNATTNAYILYEQGVFQPLCSLLRLEVSLPFERYADHSRQSSVSNSRSTSHMDLATGIAPEGGGGGSASGTFERRRSRRSATLADNERIRVVLNCIYHMVESLRREELIFNEVCAIFEQQKPKHHSPERIRTFSSEKGVRGHLLSLRKQFITELEEPLEHNKMPLAIVLLDMMPTFVRSKNPHYPIKKVILLCWKVLLTTLGGINFLRDEKARKRKDALLEPIEDTLNEAIHMKPVTQTNGPAMGGGGGGSGGDSTFRRVVGELGSKIRLMPKARPFNRQVACSSSSTSSNEDEVKNTEVSAGSSNSMKISEPKDIDEEKSLELESKEDIKSDDDFDDVNDAIMPVNEEEEENVDCEVDDECTKEDNKVEQDEEDEFSSNQINSNKSPSDLLDQILKEFDKLDDEAAGDKILENKDTNFKERKWQPELWEIEKDNYKAYKYRTYEDRARRSFSNTDDRSTKDDSSNMVLPNQRERIFAVQINESLIHRRNNEGSNDSANGGGDQTPKACQSPVKMESPWPPPPPQGLPWRSKVREENITNFLQHARQKYFNYQLPNDSTTLFGLPLPVQKSIDALRRNVYTSLGDIQLKDETRYNKYPFSQREFIEETPTERLYSRILPEMAEYVIALLKVILASLPSSKAKNDAVTILSDVLTPETDTNEVLSNSISLDLAHLGSGNVLEDNIRVAIDINRHKELIIKGASSILILLLKHFRLNHIYQFENFAQYLILANCMPLVLKFLDQNISRYFQSKHDLAPFNYPQCALYIVRNGNERPPLSADNVDDGNTDLPGYFRWRNVFSAINLLRVINKLVKWKQARTMMLVVYKSAPVLKRCMKAKLGIFQLYVLKLLKLQARYLGRVWRKTNMDIISSIYMRCRHRLNDDWAFANETTRTKSFDYHKEENELSIAIRRFNTRRYPYHQLRNELAVVETSQSAEQHNVSSNENQQQQQNQQNELAVNSASQTDELANEWDPKVWEPMDNSIETALAWEPEFSDRFIQNYNQWLEQEVYNHQIDWDGLLIKSRGLLDIYC